MHTSFFETLIAAHKRGETKGITSICSAHETVIKAAFRFALNRTAPVLIESTCNQVNQFGGYTGMTPADFVAYVERLADETGLPRHQLILGGDHLGPNPWQDEPAELAMTKAKTLVQDYVAAGYSKIHLDASMKLGDDKKERPLAKTISAQRAAAMVAVAESTCTQFGNSTPLFYVIGTEVPIPGGAQTHEESLSVTTPEDVNETIEITRQAFIARGLSAAWERVIAVVVQPGVEFGDDQVFDYEPAKASALAHFIEGNDQLVYEAHSTDYQTRKSLRQLVRDHFAILKVGPGLTFALREALFALDMMEAELFHEQRQKRAYLRKTLEDCMVQEPVHWQKHYTGSSRGQAFARKYSFSDRSRYYWSQAQVQVSLAKLYRNLGELPLPLSLLSQYMPQQYKRIRRGELENKPHALIVDKITAVLSDYAYACSPFTSVRIGT